MIKVVFNTFFIDFLILLSGIVVFFFSYVGLNFLRSGKKDNIIEENVFYYSAVNFIQMVQKNIPVLVKWFVVVFIIQCVFKLYDQFVIFVENNVNYDSVPVIALLLDLLKSLLSFIGPFLVPVLIVLFAIVVLYGLFATMEQYSARTDLPVALSEGKKRRLPPGCIRSFFNNSLVCFCKIAKFLPKIFLVVAVCIGANTLFLSVKNIGSIVNNQKRINELNMTIKNLSRAEAVAEISLVNEVKSPDAPYPIKTYKISVLNDEGDPIENQTQIFTLEGNQLAIDTMNINFDYSEIAKGEHYNIAYPYRIHSDVVTSENGVPFECFSEDGTSYPVMYGLENSVVYSMDRNTYYKNLTEIFDIAKDEVRAAEFGIRSFVGQDIHEPIYEDETYRLFVTGTGGVKLSKVSHLDVDDGEEEDSEEVISDEEVSDMYKGEEGGAESEKKGLLSTAKDKITKIFN